MFMGLFNFSLKIKQGVDGKIAKLPSLRFGLVPDDFFKPIVSTFCNPIFLLRCHGSDFLMSDKIFWTSLGMVWFYLKFYAEFKYGRVKYKYRRGKILNF